MSALSERNELLRQVQKNTEEGAEYARQAKDKFEDLASQAQELIGGTEPGDRAMFVLQRAAGEMDDIMKSLANVSAQMESYLKSFE